MADGLTKALGRVCFQELRKKISINAPGDCRLKGEMLNNSSTLTSYLFPVLFFLSIFGHLSVLVDHQYTFCGWVSL
jgi:hypothetical protein